MILKNFDNYLKTRLSKEQITKIERQAKLEKKILDVGFNDLVRILNISPMQVSKIQRGQANLTLASMAHIFSTLNEMPQLIFKKK